MAVDAFFRRNDLSMLSQANQNLKLWQVRNDANLRYRFTGKQNTGRGRKKEIW